ncbi:MAG: VWA domain-containing protein [Bacteroidales bacterium]|nr:VWA domain-containing protein [Bacteroidales bacterium]
MQLAYPKILWLFLVYVPLIAWYIMKQRNSYPAMMISSTEPFAKMPRSFRATCRHILFALQLLALGCIIVALARPQTHDEWRTSSVDGTDIVIAMDISGSMLAHDYYKGKPEKKNRLESAKEVATRFISNRENDNIGLVIFSGEALTGVPMTLDKATLTNYLTTVRDGMLADGTAIGDGLATAINRIISGKAKSKSIILLTDGSNNAGMVAPLTAAEIAKERGIKVYTIGIGSNGKADYPQIDYFGRVTYVPTDVVIDEETLKQIATLTEGKYFRATDEKVLNNIFDEIDKLETTHFDVNDYSRTEDNFELLVWIALGLILLQAILRHTYLRSIP